MTPRTIRAAGNRTRTQSYTLAPGLLQYIQSVYVEVDTTGSGSVHPTLSVKEQSGVVIAKKRQGESIPAGVQGSATWALRLDDDGGGIRFDVENVGGWLDIDAPDNGPTGFGVSIRGRGVQLDGKLQGLDFETTGGGGLTVFTDGGGISIDSNGGGVILASGGGGLNIDSEGGGLRMFDGGGGVIFSWGNGSTFSMGFQGSVQALNMDNGTGKTTLKIPTGGWVEVQDHSGNPIFRVNEDGSLQGKTGKALTFNL